MTKTEALEKIRANIVAHGHHIYLVKPGPTPKFVYTIGLSEALGAELIFAGGAYYSAAQVFEILNRLAQILKETSDGQAAEHALGELGVFYLREVDPTWTSKLVLGALDYYKVPALKTLQVVPDADHRTIDVPDLSQDFSTTADPIWQWLEKPWDYPIPANSMVMTDMSALRGALITTANHWEEDAWELYAGRSLEVEKENCRAVPFGTLLAGDPSLKVAAELDAGEGLWRDTGELEWHLNKLSDKGTIE